VTGFAYKTSWLAVRDRTVEQVAEALELHDRELTDGAAGTDRAYEYGVYVRRPATAPALPGRK
jgi:hypothetical protein